MATLIMQSIIENRDEVVKSWDHIRSKAIGLMKENGTWECEMASANSKLLAAAIMKANSRLTSDME